MTASTREVAGSCLYHFWAMPSKAVPGDWQLAQPPRTLTEHGPARTRAGSGESVPRFVSQKSEPPPF